MATARPSNRSETSAGERLKPELLAPAGDRTCLAAAVENGADAIYFGLNTGHNARARAVNFEVDDLPEVMAGLHRRGVRGYVALNTLVFPSELDGVERLIRRVIEAGVDAAIVQDLGLARLIRAVSPDLEVHASTQMSITSAEGVALAKELGCSRVILARELSTREIAKIRTESELPLEVFVHGALCVAYSGQCLTSEALGGRSANRGECAQACRMPYEILKDGRPVDLGDVRYLLSPQDLAAFELVPELVGIGVDSLKIEGRLKSPEYVANITRQYRKAIDDAWADRPSTIREGDVRDMEMSFSRGFSHGFLDGTDHKALVRGDHAKKRGIFLGTVSAVVGDRVRLDLAAPIRPGDGVVLDGDDSAGVPEQGGRIYEVSRPSTRGTPGRPIAEGLSAGPAELGFGRRDLDPRQVKVGQRVWKTDDPELSRRLRGTFEGAPRRLTDLDLTIRAVVGERVSLEGRTASGFRASVESDAPLVAADRISATPDAIREQLGRLGGTIYRLRTLDSTIEGGPLAPKSLLNALRRQLIDRLDAEAAITPSRAVAASAVLPDLRGPLKAIDAAPPSGVRISALCRETSQVAAAVESGVRTIYLDYREIKLYGEGISAARAASAEVFLATPRIQKPGEAPIFKYLDRQGADGLLVRNAGGLSYCASRGIPFVADFSLNAANELTVDYLKGRGALRVAASYDLSVEQLDDLLEAVPPGWLEVVIHQRMPLFHMEHCVFCAFLSPGTDKTNCGRPCDSMEVTLRDRVGMEHPLTADVGCRNTLFHAVPQSAAESLPRLLARGARDFRVEFLDESAEEVSRTLGLYRDALEGRRDARGLWRELKATSRYGVTRGALAVLQ